MLAKSVVVATPLLCKTRPSLQGNSCGLLERAFLVNAINVRVRGKGVSGACHGRIVSPFLLSRARWLWAWHPVQAWCWQRTADPGGDVGAFCKAVRDCCSAAAPISSQQAGEMLPHVVSSLEHNTAVDSSNFVMSSFYRIRPELSSLLTLTQNVTGFE